MDCCTKDSQALEWQGSSREVGWDRACDSRNPWGLIAEGCPLHVALPKIPELGSHVERMAEVTVQQPAG